MAKTSGGSEQADQPEHYDLVAVGASAGGIEALSTLVSSLPPDFAAPIVVAQHLDPHHPSHLAEILARRSALPVRTVTDTEQLAPGVIYVVPSDRNIEITDHVVRASDDSGNRSKPSIDRLLRTAARTYGERLIAVILTGSGSDGASGAHAVKAAGGMVVIENPATARYPAMPASLAPTSVDVVSNLDQIGPLLASLVANGPDDIAPTAPETHAPLQAILDQVRERSGIDFTQYKHPTIGRRLQRRMAVTGMESLEAYRRYLVQHPEEYDRLVASFLIKVTEFFRDAELFTALREQVLPGLIAHARAHGHELRIWSAGCATGEEAYSLAILVAESLGDELDQFSVQIFATDLDEAAVAFARHGVYPAAALAGLPGEVRDRHFSRVDGAYEVNKQLRGLIVFGQHDLAQRAPFPRIDLVLCRNVLIYFTSELQRRALLSFAFALRDGGYLVLGKAETVSPLAQCFAPTHASLKLFRRQGERVLGPIARAASGIGRLPRVERFSDERPASERQASERQASERQRPRTTTAQPGAALAAGIAPIGIATTLVAMGLSQPRTLSESLGKLMLDLAIGVVVVDHHYDIQIINSAALRLLGIYKAAVGEDLIHLTQSIPTNALRSAIDAAFHAPAQTGVGSGLGSAALSESEVTIETVLGERRHLQITCYPRVVAREIAREPDTQPQLLQEPKQGAAANLAAQTPRTPQQEPRQETDVTQVLILIRDVSETVTREQAATASAERKQQDNQRQRVREKSDRDQESRLLREENERLRAQSEQVSTVNRTLLEANQELATANLNLHSANEELLAGHEEAQASAEEVKTLNEELQATNEELVTLNEEMEATVEELHVANDDLQARARELEQMTRSLDEQRQAAEAKREQLAAILLSMGDALIVVDAVGKPVLSNAAYARMFGDSDASFSARDDEGRSLPIEATPLQRAARGENFIMEFTLAGEDDTRRYFEANGQPVRSAGEGTGGVISIRDITERSLHRLQDEFIALASHELRTPLTPLYAYLQQLAKLFAKEPDDDRARQLTARSLLQVQRLMRLVQDLLDARRLQSGKFNLEMERAPLGPILARAVEMAQMIADEAAVGGKAATAKQSAGPGATAGPTPPGATIWLEAPSTPLVVIGDSGRLEQMLMNVLTNAITYAPHSPRIDVRLRRVGDEAEIQVQDYGPGIPVPDLPHLFSRFYQVARSDQRTSRRGLGLGLYIVNELATAHGGRAEITSVEAPSKGHSTTVTIRLPLAPAGDAGP